MSPRWKTGVANSRLRLRQLAPSPSLSAVTTTTVVVACSFRFRRVLRGPRTNVDVRYTCEYNMADLEAVLADVSYLMAMEKSKSTPAARSSKKIILPDPRYDRHVDYSL